MFTWSFKSSEAMFSRWAMKRICKFLLKKKLGKFILGDINLDQLDVQLGAGTIQLSDLSLNIDYINEKFGTKALLVKEGSVGSLTVTMPWKDGGCRVEIDELEIVLAPRRMKISGDDLETSDDSENGNNVCRKQGNEPSSSGAANSSVDVHEGVKTIANMVKWLLTSFHVKIKKLIVAFDPVQEEESRNVLDRILVLRVSEVECGTDISEDASLSSFTAAHNFLGMSRLTSFLKFHGAILELLHVDGMDHPSPPEFPAETSTGNWCSSDNMTTVIAGEKGGFSGNLMWSLPWKNGSLDICKVDADLQTQPLEIRLQPSTVRSFISMWDLFNGPSEEREDAGHEEREDAGHEEREDTGHHEPSDILCTSSSCLGPLDKRLFDNNKGFVTNTYLMEKEPVHSLLSESNLISDWASRSRKDINEEESDFGASVDQFFECFDGLRNSQSALGNSGMWNWTSSVFSAITAASSLASGSLHVTSEQQHVETNFSAAIAKVSLLLSLTDEDQKRSSKLMNEANTDFNIHCVCMQFVDLFLTVQVRPLEMNFEVIVQHIQLVDHICPENNVADFNVHGCNGDSESPLIRKMQDGVQGALRTFLDSDKDPGIDGQVNSSADISLSMKGTNRCCHLKNGKDICGKDASVTLLKTSDITRCHVRINMDSSSGSVMGPTYFSLRLPPFVCWVNFEIITMMLDFLKEMANCMESTLMGSGSVLESEIKDHGFSHLSGNGKISILRPSNVPTKKTLEGNIFLPNARIILSFPHKNREDLSSNSSCNQFIAFDFISTTIDRKYVRPPKPASVASSDRKHTVSTSCSLDFNFGDFYLYSISSVFKDKMVGSETYNRQETRFSVEKIISAVNRTGYISLFSMLWQEGPATGPWIAKKAKLLASSENGRSEDKVVGKGCEYASVTTVKDSKNSEIRTRQEILSSSAFFLHGKLPPVTINLDKSQYVNICCLLNEMLEHFSRSVSEPVGHREEHSASQTSILVEFDSVTVSMAIEPVMDEHSLNSELPGSWSNLTLQVDRFELLSVTNIGGIRSANFLWVSHGQGTLWGSITKGLHQEFMLVSCSDSTMGRCDGEGSNTLSSRYSGSDIINFWDPVSNHSFTSITVRGATIVAIGARMDWFNTIFSFLNLPSSEFEQADDSLNKTRGTSFILNLVDIGLAYEPYLKKLTATQDTGLESSYLDADESKKELYVACVLAASSLRLSNTTFVDRSEGEYKALMQDLGLLVCMVSEPERFGSAYSVDYLRKIGCVKVAQEAHIEALFRKNCENGHNWELECEGSHVLLNTCHDTTLGLLRLGDQLQKLFEPDMQDYVAHLENRWNITQQVPGTHGEKTGGGDFSPSLSQSETPRLDKKSTVGNLMDEICEDAFQVDKNTDGHTNFLEPHPYALASDRPLVASGPSSSEENGFIEEYFLSELRPLSGLALKKQSSDIICCKPGVAGGPQIGNGGWYSDTSVRILENHASKVEQINFPMDVEFESSSCNSDHVDVEKAKGCIILKNMNVVWRMYGGSDWSNCKRTSHTSMATCSRDTAVCLELALSGIGFDYDVYPDGEISASRLSLTIQDFCLTDRSDDAPWKLVLGYHQSKKHPRNFSSKAVKIILEAVRPDPLIHIEENRLHITILPIRLHLHQSQLDFLINFFGGKKSLPDSSPSNPLGSSRSGEPFEKSDNLQGLYINKEAFLTYFQKFDICPMIIRVDYSPCRVDLNALKGGNYIELVNLVPWKGVELQLKHVQGVGLYGLGSVCETILGEWLEDISQNQIHKLFKGLPPIKSLVAVGSGAAKLVSLPMKHYKKDHKLLKGMQRGTFAFLRSISIEAIGLGVHLAAGAHNILLQAEYILASIPPSVPWPVESRVGTNVKSNQPNDAQQGIQQAYQSISDGLGKSASALVQSPLKKYQRGGSMGSALVTAVQSAPAAVIAPASGAALAVHCALLGFRNSLDPERKRESLEKYQGITPQRESM